MSCPYSEQQLQKWDGVTNPMGDACSDCADCDCEHWAGSCEGCERSSWECPQKYSEDELPEYAGMFSEGR